MVEEFPAYSGYGPGRGADFSFVLRGSSMKSRVVLIPLLHGSASFISTCTDDDWTSAQQKLGATLTSFRRATKRVQPASTWPMTGEIEGDGN